MHTKLLIDLIMRQTTVLIAQLASAAGIRSPLAHVADEVFLSLSQELEEQGVSRKVVADMFGLALRGYQRRVQRLRESVTKSGTTLWQAVYEHLHEQGPTTRHQLYDRFSHDDPEAIGAVLQDLVQTGLASRTGSGPATIFAATPEETRGRLAREDQRDAATALVWLDLCRHPGSSPDEVARRLNLDDELLEMALAALRREGTLVEAADTLEAGPLVIPVGAEAGWETAVFDHFQAVSGAIGAKLRQGSGRSGPADTTGGSTLSFEISETHPLAAEVRGLLARFRAETDELWDRVERVNATRPLAEEEIERVVVYFGQYVQEGERDT
jgi:hypothetical protein